MFDNLINNFHKKKRFQAQSRRYEVFTKYYYFNL